MRAITRASGELCITVGCVIVLFVLHVLFRTVVKAGSAVDDQIDSLQDQWSKGTVAAEAAAVENPEPPTAYQDGMPFAVMTG